MRKTLPITAGLIAGTLLSGAAGAATTEELEKRIQELEQTVRLLNRKQEVSEEIYVGDKAKAATAGTVKAGLDGFALVSPDKQAELKLRGLLQFDGRFGLDDDKDADTFLFRRVRPTLEGKLGKAAFRFTPEFANDDADLVDGYIDWTLPANLALRAGQFKAPVGLERLQSGSSLVFIERAFPTELAPNRDRGLALYTQPARKAPGPRVRRDQRRPRRARRHQRRLRRRTGAQCARLLRARSRHRLRRGGQPRREVQQERHPRRLPEQRPGVPATLPQPGADDDLQLRRHRHRRRRPLPHHAAGLRLRGPLRRDGRVHRVGAGSRPRRPHRGVHQRGGADHRGLVDHRRGPGLQGHQAHAPGRRLGTGAALVHAPRSTTPLST